MWHKAYWRTLPYMLEPHAIHGLVTSPSAACSTFICGVAHCCYFCQVRSTYFSNSGNMFSIQAHSRNETGFSSFSIIHNYPEFFILKNGRLARLAGWPCCNSSTRVAPPRPRFYALFYMVVETVWRLGARIWTQPELGVAHNAAFIEGCRNFDTPVLT